MMVLAHVYDAAESLKRIAVSHLQSCRKHTLCLIHYQALL